ncbi:MAG: hypothetical protein HYW24_04275 [Candidatus Aenigmarchaeota archaeon]|nr:hypothetical protein [Candidatus Aenigmarchaeota archaeon]
MMTEDLEPGSHSEDASDKLTRTRISMKGVRNLLPVAYVETSIADVCITFIDSYLEGVAMEGNAIAYHLMEELGHASGLALALGMEYASVYGVTKVLPRKLKMAPYIIGSFLHANGVLNHLDPMAGGFLPKEVVDAVDFSVNLVTIASERLMMYADSLYNIANKHV